ncbi:hypothetical protein EV08_0724 [Prochlorococcus marinus str. SS2]|nr:hypothetical protein EV08_0724 [Prochlorococcus marinus str. SS2]
MVIAGMQVSTALKKGNNADDQLAKTMVDIKKARKDALAEVKSSQIEALNELKTAKKEAMKAIEKSSGRNDDGKIWLILVGIGQSIGGGVGIEKIEMENMEQCELQGALWSSSERLSNNKNKKVRNVRYECITGK